MELRPLLPGERLAPKKNLTRGWFLEEENGAGERRLSASALADEPEGFSFIDGEGDPVDGPHHRLPPAHEPFGDGEVFAQVSYLEQGLAHGAST